MTDPAPSGGGLVAALLRQAAPGPPERLPLAEIALALGAADRPGLRLAPYLAHLDAIARDLAGAPADIAGDGVQAAAAALLDVMHGIHDYRGDSETYDDLQNANLTRVIDRRRGLPVALGILYLHAARSRGWAASGLNFPGHFLIRIDVAGERAILDPFHGGLRRGPADLAEMLKLFAGADARLQPEHYAEAGDREILLRLQNNLKLRHLKAGQLERAAVVLDGMMTIAPDRATHWREAGLVNAKLGRIAAAVAQLERFMALETDPDLLNRTRALLRDLRHQMN